MDITVSIASLLALVGPDRPSPFTPDDVQELVDLSDAIATWVGNRGFVPTDEESVRAVKIALTVTSVWGRQTF